MEKRTQTRKERANEKRGKREERKREDGSFNSKRERREKQTAIKVCFQM
jgi:hypothetical protein